MTDPLPTPIVPEFATQTLDPNAPPRTVDSSTMPGSASIGRAIPEIPGYEILREIGRGGMGVVYQARHLKLNRIVALKMILTGGHASAAELRRFLNEAESVARLQHPHIVQIFETGEHHGLPYFTLEFIEGGSLAKKVREHPLPPMEAAQLVEQLGQGMHFAHGHGVIHRDLKPDNVLLTADGTPKITDFGLAKRLVPSEPDSTATAAALTLTGAILGTPSYMAPEQASPGNEVGPLADVYSLGAILYRLITGRPPFQAASSLDTVLQVVSDEPVAPRRLNPLIARDLETICLKCLRKDPAKRYGSAEKLAEDLQHYQNGRPIVARPVGVLERARLWRRRNKSLAAALAALALTLALGISLSLGLTAWALVSAKQAKLREQQVRVEEAKTREALAAEVRRRRQVRSALDIVAGGVVNDLLTRRDKLEPQQQKFLERVVKLHEELVQDVGDDAETIRDAAVATTYVALIQQRLGRLTEAEAAYQKSLEFFQRLEQFESERGFARGELSRGWNNLGNVLREMGRPGEAEKAMQRSQEFSDAEDVHAAARTQMNVALIRELNGDFKRAETGYLEVLAKLAAAEAGPAISRSTLDLLAGCRMNLGSLLITMGRPADAVPILTKAVESSRLLLPIAAKDPGHRNLLAKSLHNLAGSLNQTNDAAGAEKAIREAIAVERSVVDEFPGIPTYRADLANHCDRLSMFLRLNNRRSDAEPFSRDAVREVALATADRPDAAELIAQEGMYRENLATLFAEQQKFDEAVPEMRRAQQAWARVKDPRFVLKLPYSRLNMMQMYYDQGKTTEMKAEAGTLAGELDRLLEAPPSESSAFQMATWYARAASIDATLAKGFIAAVGRAAKAGAFRHPAQLRHLKEAPEFEVVRKDPGFAQLLAEITKK